jgi:ribosomal protein S18 acetylase RimI-like enzyme
MIEQRPLADIDEKREVELLLARCDLAEGLELPVAIPDPGALPEGGMPPLLWIGEGRISGYLALEGWPIPEGTPIVLPTERLRGIGRALAEAATRVVGERGARRWMMVADATSAGAEKFAERIRARYDSSEYRMDLELPLLPACPPAPVGVTLDPVSACDTEKFARTLAEAFDDPLDQVRRWSAEQSENPSVRLFVASHGDRPAGVVRLITVGFHAYVTAVGVVPDYRRRGLGRWLVLSSVHKLLEEGWKGVRIEVDTTNEAAYRLYRDCGFRESRTYRSYELLASP